MRYVAIEFLASLGVIIGILPGAFLLIDPVIKLFRLDSGCHKSTRYGVRFNFDMGDYTHRKFLMRCFERAELTWMFRISEDLKTVIDVGANVGFIILPIARRLDNDATVLAFEPIPSTFIQLTKNIDLNDLNLVKAKNFAVGRFDEDLIFSDAHTSSAVSSEFFHKVDLEGDSTVKVKCVNFQTVVGSLGRIDLLKLDAEGMEYEILDSIRVSLNQRKVLKILVELNHKAGHLSENSLRVVDLLQANGYELKRFGFGGKLHSYNPNLNRKWDNVTNIVAT